MRSCELETAAVRAGFHGAAPVWQKVLLGQIEAVLILIGHARLGGLGLAQQRLPLNTLLVLGRLHRLDRLALHGIHRLHGRGKCNRVLLDCIHCLHAFMAGPACTSDMASNKC